MGSKPIKCSTTYITFHFLNFTKNTHSLYIKYEQFEHRYLISNQVIKVQLSTTNKEITKVHFYLNHFTSTENTRVYEIDVFEGKSNVVYIIMNTSKDNQYQIDFFCQKSPPKEYKHTTVSIEIDNLIYTLKLNWIDEQRAKSVVYLCNFPMIFNFIIPNISYSIRESDIKSGNRFKLCLYLLKDNNGEITCHSIPHEINKDIVTESNEKTLLQGMRQIKDKLENIMNQYNSNNYEEKNIESFFKAIEKMFDDIEKEQWNTFVDLYSFPIKQMNEIKDITFELFTTVYYLSFFKNSSETWKKVEDFLQIKYLYKKFFEIRNIYKRIIIELLLKDISFKNKLKEVSIFVSTFTLHFEAFEKNYHYPHYVDLNQINDSHYYKKPFTFVKDIIEHLKEDSFITEPLMLLNSTISTDINLNNYTVTLLKNEQPDMVAKMTQQELSQITSIEIFKKIPQEVFEINIINIKTMKKEIINFNEDSTIDFIKDHI